MCFFSVVMKTLHMDPGADLVLSRGGGAFFRKFRRPFWFDQMLFRALREDYKESILTKFSAPQASLQQKVTNRFWALFGQF